MFHLKNVLISKNKTKYIDTFFFFLKATILHITFEEDC